MLTINPIYIVWILALTTTASVIWHLVQTQKWSYRHLSIWKIFLPLTVIASLSKIPNWLHPFNGLEYEDAYVYNACARGFLYLKDFSVTPFLTQSCSVGSLKDWQYSSAYSGHLVTFPALVYGYFELFGYCPTAILYINATIAVVNVSVLYLLALQILPSKSYALAASLIFSLTPAVSLYHATGFSEVFSSLLITLYLLLFSRIYSGLDTKTRTRGKPWLWLALISTLLLAVIAKRENILLLIIPTLAAIASRDLPTLLLRLKRWGMLILTVIIVLLLERYAIDLQSTNRAEMNDALGAPFRLNYIKQLLPSLIYTLFRPSWFFVFGYFLIIGVIFILFKYRGNRVLITVLGLWMCYTAAYLTHYRSYFFVRGDEVSSTELMRYITNYYPLFCLIAALPIFLLWKNIQPLLAAKPLNKKMFYAIIVSTGIGLVVQGHQLKYISGLHEEDVRTRPVLTTIDQLKEHDILVTDEPLLYQIYAVASFEVIELRTLPVLFSEKAFKQLVKNRNVYYFNRLDAEGCAPDMRMEPARKILAVCERTRIFGEKGVFDLVALH